MKLLRKIVGYGTIFAGLTGITAGLVYGPEELKREITSNGLVRVARAARTVCSYASIFEFIETFIYLFFHFQSTKQSVMALPRSLVSANTLLRYFHHESFYMLCIPGVHGTLTGERVEMSCNTFDPFPWGVVTYSTKCTSCCCLIKGWEEGSFFFQQGVQYYHKERHTKGIEQCTATSRSKRWLHAADCHGHLLTIATSHQTVYTFPPYFNPILVFAQ